MGGCGEGGNSPFAAQYRAQSLSAKFGGYLNLKEWKNSKRERKMRKRAKRVSYYWGESHKPVKRCATKPKGRKRSINLTLKNQRPRKTKSGSGKKYRHVKSRNNKVKFQRIRNVKQGKGPGGKSYLRWFKRRKKGNVWKEARVRVKTKNKIKQLFWMLRFNETVLWQLKRYNVEKKIDKIEEKAGRLFNLPMYGKDPKLVSQLSGVVLDSGAMRDSGDAVKDNQQHTRVKLKEKLHVVGVNGTTKEVAHEYTMKVPGAIKGKHVKLTKSIDIPGTGHNLVSVGMLDDAGCKTVFEKGEGKVFDEDNKLIMYAKKIDGLYMMRDFLVSQCPSQVVNYDSTSLKLAHDVLGHIAFDVVRKMLNLPRESAQHPNPQCGACLKAQSRRGKVDFEALERAPRYGYRLHSDCSRKMPATNHAGHTGIQRYVITGDENSSYLYVDFCQRKDQVKTKVMELISRINNKIGPSRIAEFQTDGGTEYVNKALEKSLKKEGVEHRYSSPYCQYQNGWIEDKMETIDVHSKAMMFRGNAPEGDYPYAVQHAVFLNNHLPNAITGFSPFEKRTGLAPRTQPKKMKGVLFCKCTAKVYTAGKLEAKARDCVYLGKDPKTPGFLVRVLGGKKTGKEVRTAQVVTFFPEEFPYTNMTIPVPDKIKACIYASDSDQEEDGIIIEDGVELQQSDSEDSETDESEIGYESEEKGNDTVQSKDPKSEEHKLGEDDYDAQFSEEENLREELKYEPNDEIKVNKPKEIRPVGQIGRQQAWEIEEIIGEKTHRGKGKHKGKKFYLVKWKGFGEEDNAWLHCASVRAPDLVAKWNGKRDAKTTVKMVSKIMNLTMRVCQLTNEVEVKPNNVTKEEENPFKKLFDPRYQKRIEPPRGHKTMLRHIFAEHFQHALLREKMENLKWKTYVEIRRDSLPPGTLILKPVTAYDIKYNHRGEIEKFKARVCLDGSRTTVDPSECYESIAATGTIRLLLCLATRYSCGIAQTDVKNFFLQARLPEGKEYYAEIPDGWAENDPKFYVAKVLAPWYGLREAAKIAGDQLAEILKHAGLKENPWMPKVFFKWSGDDFVACAQHIDDKIWIYTSRKLLDEVLDKVDEKFKMTRTYDVKKILGCELEIDKERGMLKMHQGTYHVSKLKEMEIENCRPADSPGYIPARIRNPVFEEKQEQASEKEVRNFQKKVGIQMWGLQTDPSSMFVVHRLAGRMLNPRKEDWIEMSRVEKYRATHPEMGVVFKRSPTKELLKPGTNLDCLTYYADADLAGCETTAKSTSGYCVHLGGSGMFDWKSKKQTCVCQSSCESEVYSSKECTCHALWLRKGLSYMGFTFTKPTPICQDNTSAIALCTSDKHHARTRHFRMHVNLLKDCLRSRITRYPWIPTKYMKGDLFNKAHGPTKHKDLCLQNGIYSQRLNMISEKYEELVTEGWAETVKLQKLEAAEKAAKGR